VKSDRNSERMGAVLARPILSAKQLAESVDMPFKTARQYIEKLTKAGILREITGNSRNSIYCVDEIFDAMVNVQE
jgi:Fic family protein